MTLERSAIVAEVERVGLVPVIRAPSPELARRAARALRDGGVTVLEVTMTVPAALEVVRNLSDELGQNVIIGAGTVLDPDTAAACIEAGAQFVVSPGLRLDTMRRVHALGKAVMPGALTPTEVITAWEEGADLVKIFPCSAMGGPSYLRALKAPLPEVKLLPTGGVDLDTAAEYLAAGASALGLGSALVDIALLEREGEPALVARAQRLVEIVRRFRASR